jgi:hypothetical protein
MRHSMTVATALLILATLGVATAESQTASPPAREQQNQQQSPAPKQNALPGAPGHQRQVDDALKSESGRAGKAEPLPQATSDGAPFVDGALNVPGAPKDSETVPAKFSAHNAALDKLPTTAVRLTDEQRKKIAAALHTGNAPVAAIDATVSQKLPLNVEMLELPDALRREIPAVSELKYVPASDRILLVDPPPNRIVVAEIKS